MRFYYNIKFVLAIISIFSIVEDLSAYNGKYPIQNFTPTDYKAGIQNIDFAQNQDMNLFVANNLGVLSFNGNEWETHNFETGKKQRSLAFDVDDGRLYVGSQGEFGYFQNDWDYVSLLSIVPEIERDFDEVWDVFLHNSKVYFCTFQGIYIYDGNRISVLKNEGGFERSFLVNHMLFTQDPRGNIYEIRNDQLTIFSYNNDGNSAIAGMIEHGGGYLQFSNSGTVLFTTYNGKTSRNKILAELLKDKYVNHVFQLSDSRIVISTQTSGLVLYNLETQKFQSITSSDGLLSNACLRTFQDHSGNLWVGMQNGIALIDINSPMRMINQDMGIQGSGYETYESHEGTYYTTSNGIYYLEKNSNESLFLEGTEGPAYAIQSISGSIYAGHHTGLFKLDGRSTKRVAQTNGLWKVHQLRSNPEYAIAGTYSGLFLFKIDPTKGLTPIKAISGFDESSRFFEEDQKGNIWVGQYYKGLYKITLSNNLASAQANKVSDEYNLPLKENIILGNINNDVYIGTNQGIYMLDQDQNKIVYADMFSKDLGKQSIYLIKQDNQKNIHVITKDRVGFFKQISSENYVFIPSSLYQLRYSLNNDLLNVSVNTKEGVYYSGNEGFIRYDASLESHVSENIPIIVKRISCIPHQDNLHIQRPFEARASKIDDIVIKRGSKVLKFEIESYQFNDINNQQFWYQLDGFDEDYGLPTTSTIKEYSNLPQGEYTFSVKSKNYLGEATFSQPIKLEVKPPLHKTLGAKILYIVLAFLALVAVARIQKRRYERKQRKLEKMKEYEIDQKQKKLIEIKELREQELHTLLEEKMESEIRHVNTLLAASTMNLVVKNDFITTIREEITDVRQKGKNIETKKALEKIVREIDTSLKVQEDWDQFEHHFNLVHGDFLTRLRNEFKDLTPSEQKLSAFLRLNLNTKEIANLMSISIRGVEVSRYRLRKKLGLLKGVNLSKYILEY